MARLFFIYPEQISTNTVVFNEIDSRHLHALRIQQGDTLSCILQADSPKRYSIRIVTTGKHTTGLILNEEDITIQYTKKIHLLQCMPKLDKIEFIIQKCSELGAYELIPLYSRFIDIKGEVGSHKLQRWRQISRESSIQSGRLDIMSIQNPQKLFIYLEKNKNSLASPSSLCIILNERETATTLHAISKKVKDPSIRDIFVLIGPEGGFDTDEITHATKIYGFHSIILNGNILRTETAPIAITSILQYLINSL